MNVIKGSGKLTRVAYEQLFGKAKKTKQILISSRFAVVGTKLDGFHTSDLVVVSNGFSVDNDSSMVHVIFDRFIIHAFYEGFGAVGNISAVDLVVKRRVYLLDQDQMRFSVFMQVLISVRSLFVTVLNLWQGL